MSLALQRARTAHCRRASRTVPVWGDGFVDCSLHDLGAVRDWDHCSPDEYILLFPQLVPRANEFPAVLHARLEDCVAVRAARIAECDPGVAPRRLRSRVGAGLRHQREWFAEDGTVAGLLRRVGLLDTTPERLAAEHAILAVLDDTLALIQGGQPPAWDERTEAVLAFGAGIHPAYLWPQAAVSHARGTTAGWLGFLNRGRTALMPIVAAEYILDVLDRRDGPADRTLVDLVAEPASLAVICRAARRRAAGHNPSVRLAPDTALMTTIFLGSLPGSRFPGIHS